MAVLSRWIQATILLTSMIVLLGTVYSYKNNTFLDTSNPLLADLPHPNSKESFFANKRNPLNMVFVKKAWGWTSLAFWTVWLTAPEGSLARDGFSIFRWVGATLVWTTFVSWFFGPGLFDRIGTFTGRECVVVLPPDTSMPNSQGVRSLLTVPSQFCATRQIISPETHPALFAHPPESLVAAGVHVPLWKGGLKGIVPKFYKGHDVSGHTFLLTLSILFLVDHLVRAHRVPTKGAPVTDGWNWPRLASLVGAWALVGLWFVMLGATSVYFHSWEEKLSGFVIGVVGYVISQWPFGPSPSPSPLDRGGDAPAVTKSD